MSSQKRGSPRKSPQKKNESLMKPQNSDEEELNQSRVHKRSKKQDESPRKSILKHEINLQNYDRQVEAAFEKVDPEGIPARYLVAAFTGYIQSVEMQSDTDLQACYEIHWGEEWKNESIASSKGVSQFCQTNNGRLVFNLPFECTLASSMVGQWPQLIIIFKGFDFFGRKITKGYAQVHFPTVHGTHSYKLNIYCPQASWQQSITSWIYGTSIEYKRDFQKIILRGEGRSIGKIRTVGSVTVDFSVSLRNFNRLGYR